MNRFPNYDWLWVIFWVYFAIIEGIGIYHEAKYHTDNWTLTHFISVLVPMSFRVALLAWLAYHFLIVHKNF